MWISPRSTIDHKESTSGHVPGILQQTGAYGGQLSKAFQETEHLVVSPIGLSIVAKGLNTEKANPSAFKPSKLREEEEVIRRGRGRVEFLLAA